MSEEALRMYAELTQELCLCQDEDLKKLGKGILELAKNYDKSLKLNIKLQDKIDKAIEYIKDIRQSTFTKYNSNEWNNCLSFNDDIKHLLKILGDKE